MKNCEMEKVARINLIGAAPYLLAALKDTHADLSRTGWYKGSSLEANNQKAIDKAEAHLRLVRV